MRIEKAIGLFVLSGAPLQAQLAATSFSPPLHAGNQATNASIAVDFDRAIDPSTLDEFRVYGSVCGPVAGVFGLENAGQRVRFVPLRPFAAGEVVHVSLSESLRAMDGSTVRTEGYVSSFRVAALPAPMNFTMLSSWDADPTTFARIYGAQTCDFDGDEYSDIALICENTSDVRVYPGSVAADGAFGAMIGSPNATGSTPSPNENADLDHDGDIDIVTCDTTGDSFTVLMGAGDGTFAPSVSYSMGIGPHGIALFDADGDGDTDVATANTGSNNLAVRLNDGTGVFGPPTFHATGLDGTWALFAADMNNDYITDLVVGGRFSQEVRVMLSDGAGGLTAQPLRVTEGQTWMIVCGDVDGDGDIDVTCANGPTGNAAVLLGNGDGTLNSPVTFIGAGWMTATDLGDLDGDGDLDWVLSSFGGGRWTFHTNDGAGAFTLDQTIFATDSPACAALFDIDRDGDLDLALMDELADTCTIYENGALEAENLCFGDGGGVACPCGNVSAPGHGCANSHPTGGALLNARGRASVSADTMTLACGGMPPTSTALFFQSFSPLAGGSGLAFQDGLRCLAQPIRRLALKPVAGGVALSGGPVGDTPLSVAGGVSTPGTTVLYQTWYRDSAAFCTTATSNLSNAVRVTWTP